MRRTFFSRLAASNIKKNGRTYVPFLLTCILTTAMFYIIKSLSLNPGLKQMSGGNTVAITMNLGSWIVGLFAAIFLFYTNSFLIKQRKKEFGMFHILGMEKRHLAVVIGWETIYVALISLAAGIGVGIALDKMMFLLMGKMMRAELVLGFFVAARAIAATAALFAVIFALIFLNAVRQVHIANPVELLSAAHAVEKEPKTKWLLALLGAACVMVGYVLAIVTKDPIASISIFFVAVLLVIVGTYLLFTAGSIALLKALRKNKAYYYKASHFTSVAGMIYRMKQNAVGLANICVLSTMALVTVSVVVAMAVGVDDIVRMRYPNDFAIMGKEMRGENPKDATEDATGDAADGAAEYVTDGAADDAADSAADGQSGRALAAVRSLQKERGMLVTDEWEISYLPLMMFRQEDGITFADAGGVGELWTGSGYVLIVVPLRDYNAAMGEHRTLKKSEVFVYSMRGQYEEASLRLYGKEYRVAGKLDAFIDIGSISVMAVNTLAVVVPGTEQMNELADSGIRWLYGFDVDAGSEEQKSFAAQLRQQLAAGGLDGVTVESREEQRKDIVSLYGGFFFLGVFLASLFGMATVLIIYYKQISEGHDDKGRFAIMQDVGMSLSEVRSSIRSQVLTMFFLPLLVAGCHVAASFPLIREILRLLNFANTRLYIATTVAVFLAFAGLYVAVYALTARTYYRIVSR